MSDTPRKIRLTPAQALLKACSYCAYQERSQQEMRDKLYDWGLKSDDAESVIGTLISDNYLNEERFAIAYAGGKFRVKKWGRIKIKNELKRKNISDYCIKKALRQINDNDYREALKKLISEKQKSLKEKSPVKRKFKLGQYLMLKGYEQDIVFDLLNNN